MSTRSAQAMQVLSRFGELAWFALPVEIHPVYGYPQVSYMGWRYTHPREKMAQLIEGAVKALPTQVDWTLDRTRKNWLLLPTRILYDAQGLGNPAFADTVHSINFNDEEFRLKTLSDFELIIQHLMHLQIPEDEVEEHH